MNHNTTAFAKALEELDRHYDVYKSAADKFRLNNNWTRIAEELGDISTNFRKRSG